MGTCTHCVNHELLLHRPILLSLRAQVPDQKSQTLKGTDCVYKHMNSKTQEEEQEKELLIGEIKDEVESAGPRFRQTWAVVSDARHKVN